MARKSTFDKLPPELREAVDKLVANPQLTLEQILKHVRALGVETSTTALHRHQKDIATVGERIRRSDSISRALVEKFGEADDDKVARLNHQILQTAIMDILAEADEDGAPVTLSPVQVVALSKSLNELARAQRTRTETTFKIRKETVQKAAKVIESTPGLSKDTIDDIKRRILGIAA